MIGVTVLKAGRKFWGIKCNESQDNGLGNLKYDLNAKVLMDWYNNCGTLITPVTE